MQNPFFKILFHGEGGEPERGKQNAYVPGTACNVPSTIRTYLAQHAYNVNIFSTSDNMPSYVPHGLVIHSVLLTVVSPCHTTSCTCAIKHRERKKFDGFAYRAGQEQGVVQLPGQEPTFRFRGTPPPHDQVTGREQAQIISHERHIRFFRIPKLHFSVFLALSQLHQINNFANISPIGHHQGTPCLSPLTRPS